MRIRSMVRTLSFVFAAPQRRTQVSAWCRVLLLLQAMPGGLDTSTAGTVRPRCVSQDGISNVRREASTSTFRGGGSPFAGVVARAQIQQSDVVRIRACSMRDNPGRCGSCIGQSPWGTADVLSRCRSSNVCEPAGIGGYASRCRRGTCLRCRNPQFATTSVLSAAHHAAPCRFEARRQDRLRCRCGRILRLLRPSPRASESTTSFAGSTTAENSEIVVERR